MHFQFLPKFSQAMDEVEHFFGQFPNPWALRVSQNAKKAKFTAPLCPLFNVHWKGPATAVTS
jgi:hypothetical protein